MSSSDKSKTSLTKFEEFFLAKYKDNVLDLLEKYPDERSLVVDYVDLKNHDSNLADLLIENPEDVILASEKAIKNIDPLMRDVDLNVRFENLANLVSLKNLNAKFVGKFISVEGLIANVEKPNLRIDIAVFECKSCMRLREVHQGTGNTIVEPSLCTECSGRSFGLLYNESSYVDVQWLVIKSNDTSRRIKVVLEDDLVDYDEYGVSDFVRVNGVLKTSHKSGTSFDDFIHVNYVEKLDIDVSDVEEVNIDYTGRDSAEYKEWMNNVLSRDDSVCVVCGERRAPHTHHIFSYKGHPDYRLNVDNGVILCRWCHHQYHDIFGKDTANPVSFISYLKGDY